MKSLIFLLLLISLHSGAQDLKKATTDYFSNQDWAEAEKGYKELIVQEKSDSSYWYNLAYCQLMLKSYDEALINFQEAKKRNITPTYVDINISKIYAFKKDEKGMYNALNEGLKNNLFAYSVMQNHKAFAPYRSNKEFQDILVKVKLNAYPCLRDNDRRHFDFWLGEWDVYSNGAKVGMNVITMAEGGCAIHENYTTSGNYSGQSINFFDPVDKKWHQHWVGSGGDVYNYVETERAEGMLKLESPYIDQRGNKALSKLTFTLNPDQTVTQLFETSYDEGKSWQQGFLGIYKKR